MLQTKMWTAMPWRPLGSPAPHKVCSPCGQTPSSMGSEGQAVSGAAPFLPHPIPLLGLTPHTGTPLLRMALAKYVVGFSLKS